MFAVVIRKLDFILIPVMDIYLVYLKLVVHPWPAELKVEMWTPGRAWTPRRA